MTVRIYNCSTNPNASCWGLNLKNDAGNDMIYWVMHSVIIWMYVISSRGELGTQSSCVNSSTGVLRNIFCRSTKLEGIRKCSRVRPSENDKSCAHSSHRFFWKIYQLLVYGPVHHLPIFFFFGRIVRPEKNRENWRAVLKVGSIRKIPVPIRKKRWFWESLPV